MIELKYAQMERVTSSNFCLTRRAGDRFQLVVGGRLAPFRLFAVGLFIAPQACLQRNLARVCQFEPQVGGSISVSPASLAKRTNSGCLLVLVFATEIPMW
jgi:hypothetical protein